MAVNKTINKRTNTHGAMRNCIEYVLRQDKTGKLLTYIGVQNLSGRKEDVEQRYWENVCPQYYFLA